MLYHHHLDCDSVSESNLWFILIHVLNLHAVLQTGQLFILSHGTHIDTQNCVALLPTGKLHSCLCVCKSTLSVPAYRISTAGPSGLCVQYGSVHLSASVSLSFPTNHTQVFSVALIFVSSMSQFPLYTSGCVRLLSICPDPPYKSHTVSHGPHLCSLDLFTWSLGQFPCLLSCLNAQGTVVQLCSPACACVCVWFSHSCSHLPT